jgi:putative ABC transport system permease protein
VLYAPVTPIARLIRSMSPAQPVEHAATLEDVRAEVLTPDRLNSLVFGIFAGVALAIAVVGVAGVLAFSVSARTREFGIRLALGSEPQRILKGVITEGVLMAALGVLAGAAFGLVAARLAGSYFVEMKMPGALPVIISAFLLMTVAVVASLLPAVRAARVDVMEALRSE